MSERNAPKDPTAKGSSFYLFKNKEVVASPTEDGKGMQPIYLSDRRVCTFANLVGNIQDEAMLDMLVNADTFLDMVAGIGVSIESDDIENEINFAFQMYGKKDPYVSGTTINISCIPDGMEHIVWFDDVQWTGDDDVVGQARFEFVKPEIYASVNVRLYLRQGYEAPPIEEENEIDFESEDYKKIIEKSLVSTGNNNRLKRVIEKAKSGQDVTVAFIGGSITQGAGAVPINTKAYAYQTYEHFKNEFGTGDNIHFIKGGVGGTPSELGMIRFERDILREGTVNPDLVVIEFAVNDEDDETKGRCYECLIRKALSLSKDTAVLLIYAVFADDWNLQERLSPCGFRYQLPMASVRDAVVEQFYKKLGKGRVVSKNQFFYDRFHPTNAGHKIMADTIMNLIRAVDAMELDEEFDWEKVEPVFGIDFTNVRLLDKKTNFDKCDIVSVGDFTEEDKELQLVEFDDEFAATPVFPYNWHHVKGNAPFVMKLPCKALLRVSMYSGSAEFGKADIYVDGEKVLEFDPRQVGWTHCHASILFTEEETKEHTIEIKMASGDEDKLFTILGFGYVE